MKPDFSVASNKWTRGHRHKLKYQNHLNIRKYFDSGGGQALTQVPQKGCSRSVFESIQNLTGHGPEQPAPTDPALGMELDKTISGSPFQNQQFWNSQVEEVSLCPMQILKTATASIRLYFIPEK